MILLDTNVLGEPLRKTPHRKVYARLGIQAGNFAASIITLSELRFGAMLHPQSEQFWSKIETMVLPLVHWMPIDHAIALQAADLKAHLHRKGRTAGTNDCLIAATALVNDWVLVTRNTDHFKQMPGLQLENWFK
ncbi:MAG: type II toxin-antitoxin system VapC family toxin [Methylacidiphilales bacterium]|nr:type II toxin-antitoxin system VapC family toxin [Candidatus Methylacidiphilales bacterium]